MGVLELAEVGATDRVPVELVESSALEDACVVVAFVEVVCAVACVDDSDRLVELGFCVETTRVLDVMVELASVILVVGIVVFSCRFSKPCRRDPS